jgi:tetratricopeptide (TPR) repeat protein
MPSLARAKVAQKGEDELVPIECISMTMDANLSQSFQQALNESANLLRQNRPAEAIRLLEPLYAQAPTQVDVAINLGGAYILQRKWNRAVAVLSKAVAEHPDHVMLWVNLAAAYLGNLETAGPKHQERAIAAYERALALDPKTPNVHYHLGLIYKERGEWAQAAAYFEQALVVAPQDRDAQYWLKRLSEHIAQSQGQETAATRREDDAVA